MGKGGIFPGAFSVCGLTSACHFPWQDIAYKLRIPQRKPWAAIIADVDASAALMSEEDRVLYGVPPGQEEEVGSVVPPACPTLRLVALGLGITCPLSFCPSFICNAQLAFLLFGKKKKCRVGSPRALCTSRWAQAMPSDWPRRDC
jgi:hypothetical protein